MGGRPNTTGSETHRAYMRRYRARLAADGTPEIDDVDRALVQSLLGAIDEASERASTPPEWLRAIVSGAKSRLLAAGFEKGPVATRLKRRLEPVVRR
ncbi:hypothetical protein [Bosea sp. 47.2.35]|uniref:hypothetical protein n=1 Tax=Bosea sp. 47.2.35 TaxID=2969304 RepID=UPI0021504455|nr:hypothetical protein [Bosea sp. 47.2.35]MCR4521681.1 hypothetical protein [Bosea sp. 47.2.35]